MTDTGNDTAERTVEDPTGASDPSLFTLPRSRRVWVNRSLRMDQIEWVGFDMDYTLAIYRQEEIDQLSVRATLKKLIDRGYPPELAEVRYRTDFPVRGLLIDKRHGHVLKMDRYKFVGKAYHGLKEISREERRDLYHARKVRPEPPRYHWIDTLYALPEAALYTGAVDALDKMGVATDYVRLFDDIRECIDEAHQDGAIVDVIQENLVKFVEKDPQLPWMLHKLRSAGKKLFLLTNSRWNYTHAMMSFLLDGMMAEYPSWRNFFDVVVAAAGKPAFFTQRRPFMERIGDTVAPTGTLERGKAYENGNLRDFERMIHSGGDAILYVGDHIYGDILRTKRESAWRTAMIVQELGAETVALEHSRTHVERLDSLARKRDRLEDELRFRQARLKTLARALGEPNADGTTVPPTAPNGGRSSRGNGSKMARASTPPPGPDDPVMPVPVNIPRAVLLNDRTGEKKSIERIRVALRDLDEESRVLEQRVDAAFHTYWGPIFKQGVELSSFGDQVESYACLYTAKASNFLAYSPLHFFRSPRDFMPHELP